MKMYLLLRNNVATGPYNIENLKKENLEKYDLIWVENESITWKYPSEINEFKNISPKAELTYGTIVNNLKEKQIRYFREYNIELDYKKNNLAYINKPDAFVSDIPEGYEYLVVAGAANNCIAPLQEASETFQPEEIDYTLLGEKQRVNTAETIADHQQFTTVMYIKKKVRALPPAAVIPLEKKKKLLFKIAGIGIFAALVFGHIKF